MNGEPPDLESIDTIFQPYRQLRSAVSTESGRDYLLTIWRNRDGKTQIVMGEKLADVEARLIGTLAGVIPADSPAILKALSRDLYENMSAQLLDRNGIVLQSTASGRVVHQTASLEPLLARVRSGRTGTLLARVDGLHDSLVSFSSLQNAPWVVTLDEDNDLALAGVRRLRWTLVAVGILFWRCDDRRVDVRPAEFHSPGGSAYSRRAPHCRGRLVGQV